MLQNYILPANRMQFFSYIILRLTYIRGLVLIGRGSSDCTIYVSFYTPMLSDHIFLEDLLSLINVYIIRVNSNQNASTWY